ncbi:MAG: hypothetical protein MJ247_04340 [Alphaproteobacteria bacterium]|nr:hypothetical protein [Alphaproteobacteria bacterium]
MDKNEQLEAKVKILKDNLMVYHNVVNDLKDRLQDCYALLSKDQLDSLNKKWKAKEKEMLDKLKK